MDKHTEDSIAKIDLIIEEQRTRRVRKIITHKEQPKSRIGQNSLVLLHRFLGRSIALLEAGKSMIDDKSLIALAVITRAHFETTGSVAYLLKQFKRRYGGETTVQELDVAIHKLFFGSSSEDLPHTTDPLNVMSGIDAADDLIKFRDDGKPVFRAWYDLLSEYAHPNYDGTAHHAKVKPDLSEIEFLVSDEAFGSGHGLVQFLETTGGCFIIFFDQVLVLLEEHEEVPITEK